MKKKAPKTLTGKEYFAYSAGLFGYAMITGFVGSYQQIFYTNVLLLAPEMLVTLFLVARIWDAVNDPLEGFIIDRTSTRWGKFRPYILFMTGPLIACTVIMFTSFNFNLTGKLIVVYITYLLYGSLCSLADSSARGIACVTVLDGDERAKFISVGNILRAIGNSAPLVALLVIEFLLKKVYKTDSAPLYQSLNITAWICAVGGGILFLLIFFYNKERLNPPHRRKSAPARLRCAYKKQPPLANCGGF